MAVTYKVVVMKIDDETRMRSMSGSPDPVVLFEAGSPDAGRLLGYAPGEVEAALIEQAMRAEAENMPQRVVQGFDPQDVPPLAEPVEAEPEQQGSDEPAEGEGKPKRKRRTKAEIEADRAAAERIAAAATEPASATPEPAAQTPTEPLHTAEDQAAPPPQAALVPAAAEAPAQPWNPFAK